MWALPGQDGLDELRWPTDCRWVLWAWGATLAVAFGLGMWCWHQCQPSRWYQDEEIVGDTEEDNMQLLHARQVREYNRLHDELVARPNVNNRTDSPGRNTYGWNEDEWSGEGYNSYDAEEPVTSYRTLGNSIWGDRIPTTNPMAPSSSRNTEQTEDDTNPSRTTSNRLWPPGMLSTESTEITIRQVPPRIPSSTSGDPDPAEDGWTYPSPGGTNERQIRPRHRRTSVLDRMVEQASPKMGPRRR